MNLQDLAEAAPAHWKPAIIAGSFVLGLTLSGFGYLFNTKADQDDALTKVEFYQYMEIFRDDLDKDFRRLEDKIDEKADKP